LKLIGEYQLMDYKETIVQKLACEDEETRYIAVVTPPILHSYATKRNTSEGVLYCSAECFLSRL